jgi:hypothetical protein
MSQTVNDLVRKSILGLFLCLLLGGCGSVATTTSAPSIEFSKVPRADEGGPGKLERIAGRVKNAQPEQQIVLFTKSSGLWWVQPLADQPFTAIERDSTWKNDTHLGTEYAALLVKPGYRVTATAEMLPAIGGDVVAVAVVKGDTTSPAVVKTLHFSGYEWKIRTAGSDRGGTRNAYDPANVWTDENGFLHLRIARRDEQWTCAEIQLTRSLGYGSYRFVVQESSHLEPAAVLSMFTWDELSADQNHRELDIEITRWGDPTSKNAQYVVQPFYVPANVARFAAPSGMLTHSFRWEPERVTFRTTTGNSNRRPARVVAEQVFTSGIPAPGGETIHLNLYIFGTGKQPMQQEAEVVIEKFEYLP